MLFLSFLCRLVFVMVFLVLGILSTVVFVVLGFFYAYFTPGYYWEIYGYVIFIHILCAPFWSFELCLWLIVQSTMNKLQRDFTVEHNDDDLSTTINITDDSKRNIKLDRPIKKVSLKSGV